MGSRQPSSTPKRKNHGEDHHSPKDKSHKNKKSDRREALSSQGQVVPTPLEEHQGNMSAQIITKTPEERTGSYPMVRESSPYQTRGQNARPVQPQFAWLEFGTVAFGICPIVGCGLPVHCANLDCSIEDEYYKTRCWTCRPKGVKLDTHWYICESRSCGILNFPREKNLTHPPSEDRCMQCHGRSVYADMAHIEVECLECRKLRLGQHISAKYCPRQEEWQHMPVQATLSHADLEFWRTTYPDLPWDRIPSGSSRK